MKLHLVRAVDSTSVGHISKGLELSGRITWVFYPGVSKGGSRNSRQKQGGFLPQWKQQFLPKSIQRIALDYEIHIAHPCHSFNKPDTIFVCVYHMVFEILEIFMCLFIGKFVL